MANKFEWESEYSLNITLIDEQHQNFFKIANHIEELAEHEEIDRQEIIAVIGELLNYSLYHFSVEEELFYSLEYPERTAHIEAHNAFRLRSGQFMERTMDENLNAKELAEEVAEYVIGWLTGHILVVDKKYAPFFKEKGIE